MIIRKPEISDARAIAEVHVKSWQSAYKGLMPQSLLSNLSIDKRELFWRGILENKARENLIIELSDQVIGWAAYGKARDGDIDHGKVYELYGIYLLEEYWGQRLGYKLWERVLEEIKAKNALEIVLWVLRDNERAIRFYRSIGFVIEQGKVKEDIREGVKLPEVRYRRYTTEQVAAANRQKRSQRSRL